ncbi:MAG: DEAD/DEAH box helicase [bacterium]|nr:DEAD/DEAH box helicase [bacterium]
MSKFADFGLSKEMLQTISNMGFEEPTPIQEKAIPVIMQGNDMIGQAQTGTGKTAAFGIPVVERIDRGIFPVQAIILTPTRELAIQVAEEMNKIGKLNRVFAFPVYGGSSIERQIRMLQRGVHVVVGTPGRVIDHIERDTLKLNDVKVVILDEADEMLDMGFKDDITTILSNTPKQRQTLLFSATMPEPILRITKQYMVSPEKITISTNILTAPKIDQIFYEISEADKVDALTRLIDAEDSDLFLVFCHTKREVDDVAASLKNRGYDAETIHGDFNQSQREAVMKRFKNNMIDVLVATDVAARGLDISNISHVVNYSIPQNPEAYIHRIGRTGRAGKSGVAITFVTPREDRQLRLIQAVAKTKIKRGKLPSLTDVINARIETLKEKIQEFIDDKKFDTYLELADKITEGITPAEAVAALLKFQLEGFTKEESVQEDTGAAPGMVRLFMNVGRQQKINAGDIVRAIADKASIAGKSIGSISIFDTFTFVEVPKENAEKVLEVMHQSMLSGKKVAVAKARPRVG